MSTKAEQSSELEPVSPSTAVTTPEQDHDQDDDIWGSESPTNRINHDEILSDLPTIKRQHMTDGYREGLAIGKAKVMQQGFDDGYPIGVQIAMRAGLVLGILEGYLASKSISQSSERKVALQKIYDRAKNELSCPALLKNIDDEVIAQATSIPPAIEAIISTWETSTMGIKKGSDS